MDFSWNQALFRFSTKTTRNNWYQSCRSSVAMTQTLTTRTFTINELNSRIYLDGLCFWCEESYHPSSECKENLWSKIKLTDDTGKFLCYVDFDDAEKSTNGSLDSHTLAIEESIDDGHETLLPNFQQSGQFSSDLSLLKFDFNGCDDESCLGNGVEVSMVTGIVGVEMMKPSTYVNGLSLPMAMNELVISLGGDETIRACDSFNSEVGDYVHNVEIPFSCDLLKINEEKHLGNSQLDCLGVFSSREGADVRPTDEPPGAEDSFIMRVKEIDVHSGEFVGRGIALNRSRPGVRRNAKTENEEVLVSCVDYSSIMKACDSTRTGFELVSVDKVFVSNIIDMDVAYFMIGDLKIWIGRNTHDSDCWHCVCCVDEDWVCKTNGCDRALRIDDKVLSQAKFMTIVLQEMVSKAELYVGAGTIVLRWSAREFSCNKEKKWAETSLLSKLEEDQGGTRIVGIARSVLLDGNEFTMPMVTNEGCLVAHTNRGCKAIYASARDSLMVLTDGPDGITSSYDNLALGFCSDDVSMIAKKLGEESNTACRYLLSFFTVSNNGTTMFLIKHYDAIATSNLSAVHKMRLTIALNWSFMSLDLANVVDKEKRRLVETQYWPMFSCGISLLKFHLPQELSSYNTQCLYLICSFLLYHFSNAYLANNIANFFFSLAQKQVLSILLRNMHIRQQSLTLKSCTYLSKLFLTCQCLLTIASFIAKLNAMTEKDYFKEYNFKSPLLIIPSFLEKNILSFVDPNASNNTISLNKIYSGSTSLFIPQMPLYLFGDQIAYLFTSIIKFLIPYECI